jgi:DNA-binding GntR family transcriptional regulator
MVDMGGPLVKESLVYEVAERLRDLILKGQLPPGMRLHQEELSQALGVSRTPLRQALALLVEEGFVSRSSKAQYTVASMDASSLLELYLVRRELDGLAAELAASRRTAPQLETMQRELDAMAAAEPHDWLVHHQKFHLVIYEASRNPHLTRLQHTVLLSIRLFNPQLTASHSRRTESYHEQTQIFQAIAEQNPSAAREHARLHITNAMQLVSGRLSE